MTRYWNISKKHFQPKLELQLLEIDAIDVVIVKGRILVQLFKLELPQTAMPAHMTNMVDDA